MSKTIVINNIGHKGPDIASDKHADVTPGVSIRIYGSEYNKPFDKTFKLGDIAEYDSFNLSYMGEIVSITPKSVTIQPSHGRKKRRLSLNEFIWRNKNFDVSVASAANAEAMNYI